MFDHDSLDTYVFSLATSRIAPFLRPDEIGFTKDNTETAQTLSFLKHFTPLTKNKNCKHFGTKTIILFGISYHQGQESWPLPRTPSNRNKIKHKKNQLFEWYLCNKSTIREAAMSPQYVPIRQAHSHVHTSDHR